MSNLTITIDDELLRAARVKAVQQGTSVNEVCRQAIAAFALGDQAAAQARAHARAQAFTEFCNGLVLSPPPPSRGPGKQSVASPSRDGRIQSMRAKTPPPANRP